MELSSYEEFANSIKAFLIQEHALLKWEADEAITVFSLQGLYNSDPEMATHTAVDKWADDILYCWKRKKCN